jgi:hypothetical protein
MNPGNANAPAGGRGARIATQAGHSRQAPSRTTRIGAIQAACFSRSKTEDWHADYQGLMVTQGLAGRHPLFAFRSTSAPHAEAKNI